MQTGLLMSIKVRPKAKVAASSRSVAQMGERLPYKQGVTGSSPAVPISQSNMVKYKP